MRYIKISTGPNRAERRAASRHARRQGVVLHAGRSITKRTLRQSMHHE